MDENLLIGHRAPFQVVVSAPTASLPSSVVPLNLDSSQLRIITNLCSILRQPCYPCMGFSVDCNGVVSAYPAQKPTATYVENSVTLNDLLSRGTVSFSKQEVYTLSITLVCSLLQLNHTPWLKQSWNKTDIIFLRANSTSAVAVDVKHPYLTHEHKSDGTLSTRRQNVPRNDCSKLLALGVMLVEISCSQCIEKLRKPEDLGPNNEPTELSNLNAVRRWLEQQQNMGNISFAFYSAISYCLKCFVDPTANLDNPEFSRTIEERVLAPLEEERNMLLGPISSLTTT
jgi:hypothetical protein